MASGMEVSLEPRSSVNIRREDNTSFSFYSSQSHSFFLQVLNINDHFYNEGQVRLLVQVRKCYPIMWVVSTAARFTTFFFPVPFILLRIFSLKVMKCFLYHSVSLKYSSNYLNKRLLPHRNSVSTYTQTSKGKESLMNKIIPRHLAINFTNNRKCYNNSQLVYSMQCSAWDQNLSNSWPLE